MTRAPDSTVDPLDLTALQNTEFSSEFTANHKAKLAGGRYQEAAAPGSATMITIQLDGAHLAKGDLTGDGVADAAVVLVSEPGGSGTFYELAVVMNDNGTPKHLASAPLGDRVKIERVAVESGVITVEMLTQGPNDPMASPTLAVTKKFRVDGEKLVEAK